MRILLSGYYGFGNLGDDALLEIIVRRLQREHPFATLDVLSAQPEETRREYGVDATPRGDIGAVRRAIADADIVVSGGGGLLQNRTSLRSLLYYAGIVRSGIRAGKKTMIFAQSVGPLDFWGKLVVREFCRGISAATVRDERSRALLAPLVPQTAVERTADPVFLLEPATDVDLRIEGLGPESDPLAIVSVRRWPNGDATASVIAAAIDRLADHGVRTAFLPLGGAADAEASTAVIRRCKTAPTLLPSCDLPHAAQIIARAKLVIGMRLHALILAARFGVPFLAVPYDPKVVSLCDDLAYPLPPLWEAGTRGSPDLPAVRVLVDRAWAERETLAAHLRNGTARMQALASKNFEALGALLES